MALIKKKCLENIDSLYSTFFAAFAILALGI